MNVISPTDVTQMQRNLSAACQNLKGQLLVAFHLLLFHFSFNCLSSEYGFVEKWLAGKVKSHFCTFYRVLWYF
jgi:hypothetical protein